MYTHAHQYDLNDLNHIFSPTLLPDGFTISQLLRYCKDLLKPVHTEWLDMKPRNCMELLEWVGVGWGFTLSGEILAESLSTLQFLSDLGRNPALRQRLPEIARDWRLRWMPPTYEMPKHHNCSAGQEPSYAVQKELWHVPGGIEIG